MLNEDARELIAYMKTIVSDVSDAHTMETIPEKFADDPEFLELEAMVKAMKNSSKDTLTQLYNRLKMNKMLEKELERSERTQTPFGMIILDIDFFKTVNETHGYPAGDKVLVELATILKENVRSTDILGRWGDKAFLILLPDTDKNGVIVLAEKLRVLIENNHFTQVDRITASFGIAAYKKDLLPASIISRADRALRKAKEKGRNRVEFF